MIKHNNIELPLYMKTAVSHIEGGDPKSWQEVAEICSNAINTQVNGVVRRLEAIMWGAEIQGMRNTKLIPTTDETERQSLYLEAHALGFPVIAFAHAASELVENRSTPAQKILAQDEQHKGIKIKFSFEELRRLITLKFPAIQEPDLNILRNHYNTRTQTSELTT
ncbi:MAG: hypothetical protein ABTQ34_04595 [Bdellovibrionales bacterium]